MHYAMQLFHSTALIVNDGVAALCAAVCVVVAEFATHQLLLQHLDLLRGKHVVMRMAQL